jgi:DNA-binding NarL/FixJ family response regulator
LSERTVETHITNILNKLGLNSRTQISRWMADLNETGLTAAEERP